MTVMVELLRSHPEIALFAALALGFFLGKRKIGGFSLGTAAGVLIAGVLIGQFRIPIPELLKSVAFALFIFVVGYRDFRPKRRKQATRLRGEHSEILAMGRPTRCRHPGMAARSLNKAPARSTRPSTLSKSLNS